MRLRDYLDGLLHMIYPALCEGCEEKLPLDDDLLCINCHTNLPYTGHFDLIENSFTDKFIGRIQIEYGASLLHYSPEGITSSLIHKLKYQQLKKIGIFLGKIIERRYWSLTGLTLTK